MRRHLVLSLTLLLISIGLYTVADAVQPYRIDGETAKKVAAFFADPVPLLASTPDGLSHWLDEKMNLPPPVPPARNGLPTGTWTPEGADYGLEIQVRERFAESGVSESDLRVWISQTIDARHKNRIAQGYSRNAALTLIGLSSLYVAASLIMKSLALSSWNRLIISTYIFYYSSVLFFYMTDFFQIVDDENIKPLLAVPLFFTGLAYPLYKWVTHSKG